MLFGRKGVMNKEEKIVREKLITMGFLVSKQRADCANGIDLIAMKDGIPFLIEVKKAYFNSRSWKVPKIQKSGLSCDIIAIVLEEQVIFESMEDHLKLCDKGGFRSITKKVNFLKLAAGL